MPPTYDRRRCTTALLSHTMESGTHTRTHTWHKSAHRVVSSASYPRGKPITHTECNKRARQAHTAPPVRILDVKRPIQPCIGRAVRAVQTARCRVRVLDVSPRAGNEWVEIGRTRVSRGRWDHRKLLCRAFDRLPRKNCKRVAAAISK